MHDERIRDTALMGLALPALEGRVARPSPAPRVVVVRVGRAEQIDALQILLEALGNEVEEEHFVVGALWSALRRGAVVAHDDEDGVVELAE